MEVKPRTVFHPQDLGAHGWVRRAAGLDRGDMKMGQRVGRDISQRPFSPVIDLICFIQQLISSVLLLLANGLLRMNKVDLLLSSPLPFSFFPSLPRSRLSIHPSFLCFPFLPVSLLLSLLLSFLSTTLASDVVYCRSQMERISFCPT